MMRRQTMRINTQSTFFLQRAGKNVMNPLLPGSVKKRITQEANWQQDLHQKVSALTRKNNTYAIQEQEEALQAGQFFSVMFPVSEKDVPGAIAGEIERYHQSAGNAVDNLTCMEEQIKYMQAEYDKARAEGDNNKAEVLEEWMSSQFKDMSWTVSSVMGMSYFRTENAGRLYGEAFGREAKEQLSGLHAGTGSLLERLKGAGNSEEALQRLAEVKKELMQQADTAAQKYKAYTGDELAAYAYKGAEDYAGIKWDSHIIYNRSLELVEGEGLSVNLGEYGRVDLSQIKEAVNLVDLKA